MSLYVAFFAEGTPKGQPRPRAFARNGKARVFDPGTAEGWKAQVALAARAAGAAQLLLETPVYLAVRFVMPRPKRLAKAGAAGTHTSKPDLDNLAKAVMDALTTIGVWRDDAQVAGLTLSKAYAAPGCAAGAMIEVSS